jgi:hypothetical protein
MTRPGHVEDLAAELAHLEASIAEQYRARSTLQAFLQAATALEGLAGSSTSQGGTRPSGTTMLAASLGAIQLGLIAMLLMGGGEEARPLVADPEVPVLQDPEVAVAEALEEVARSDDEQLRVVEEVREAPPEPERELTTDEGFQSTVVASFPFEDRRTTAASDLRRVDNYSCAPATDESGPEIWYAVDVPRSGRLEASIVESKVDGIDVDVHILSRPAGDACLSRGNARAAATVDAGRYWVAIDTYVVSGVEKSGGYELSIRLD